MNRNTEHSNNEDNVIKSIGPFRNIISGKSVNGLFASNTEIINIGSIDIHGQRDTFGDLIEATKK